MACQLERRKASHNSPYRIIYFALWNIKGRQWSVLFNSTVLILEFQQSFCILTQVSNLDEDRPLHLSLLVKFFTFPLADKCNNLGKVESILQPTTTKTWQNGYSIGLSRLSKFFFIFISIKIGFPNEFLCILMPNLKEAFLRIKGNRANY